jgi:hypothetical protein
MTVNGDLLVIGFGIAAPIVAQDGPAKFQLPTPVQVHGVVVDSAGDPIAEVRIDNIALPEDFAKADASGRFEFVARGPSVVFRKSGWTGRLVRVSSSTGNIRVVLERAGDPPPLRNCGKKEKCGTAPLGGFCFPKVRGVGAGNWVPTLDTLEQQFSIHSWFGLDRNNAPRCRAKLGRATAARPGDLGLSRILRNRTQGAWTDGSRCPRQDV